MRICAAADIHYPRFGTEWARALARGICEAEPDVVILAGDVSAGPDYRYRQFLGMFETCGCPKLFVPGNHDLWSDAEEPDTPWRYSEGLRKLVEDCDFHYLPGDPLALGDVGFAGTIGWWDYAYRQIEPPYDGLRVIPLAARVEEEATKLVTIPGRILVPWEELTETDYDGKALVWQDRDGAQQSIIWNDVVHVDWGMPDADVARRCADELAADLASLGPDVSTILGVTHFVPFADLLTGHQSDVQAAYCRAFMGSPLLGETLERDPRTRLVICGHQHRQHVTQRGEMVLADCGVARNNDGPLLLTLPEVQPR
ncbi:MAG: metallophosphoesterase [Armatimonadetes bacterium]|jgi:predicted phosphodiesterase|nr:metallophosphoesterase [Armatimonadota bacterium]